MKTYWMIRIEENLSMNLIRHQVLIHRLDNYMAIIMLDNLKGMAIWDYVEIAIGEKEYINKLSNYWKHEVNTKQ